MQRTDTLNIPTMARSPKCILEWMGTMTEWEKRGQGRTEGAQRDLYLPKIVMHCIYLKDNKCDKCSI